MNEFTKYLKAVGTGKKHNYDLTKEEMLDLISLVFDGKVLDEQLSAFLLGWRLKPETTDEFIGILEGFDKYIKRVVIPNSIEFGYPYDGKRNNPFLFSLISKELEKFNLNIVVTGDELQPSKEGVTLKDIYKSLSKKPSNLHYFERSDILKPLSDLTKVRINLGLRTGLNSIEKLINPASSDIAFIGVYHKPFMEKYVKIFAPRYKKLVIVKGNEGTTEIYSKTQFWIVENGETTEYKVDPMDFNINYTKSWEAITLEESLECIENPTDDFLNIVKLNVALILFVTNKVATIEDGYKVLQ